MKTLLCHGRLDIPFKKLIDHIPPLDYSNLPPIRQHWAKAYELIRKSFDPEDFDETVVPMWELTDDFYRENHHQYDRIIVPHRQRLQFEHLEDEIRDKMVFLMQTVRPEYFTLDRNGWGANLSFLPVDNEPILDINYVPGRNGDLVRKIAFMDDWRIRFLKGISKFPQPPSDIGHAKNFDILFVCQIPHDETIKYHSDVTVEETLKNVLDQAEQQGLSVLVKGHPVNPASMEPLKAITAPYLKAKWASDALSIKDALTYCKAVALVNSGVGFEAMLMGKPIFSYGRSEYQNIVNYKKTIDITGPSMIDYSPFLYKFFTKCLNTSNEDQFKVKLREILK